MKKRLLLTTLLLLLRRSLRASAGDLPALAERAT